jgi:hypothetical protein
MMEADGSSGNFCGYCNKPGHQADQCRDQASDRRLEIALGCVAGLFLVPFAFIGFILGFIGSAALGGIRYGFDSWPKWTVQMKKLFRKEKP